MYFAIVPRAACAWLTLFLLTTTAKASIINFEDVLFPIPGDSNVTFDGVDAELLSGGFKFLGSAEHYHLVNDHQGLASFNGSNWIGWDDAHGDSTVTMTKVGGGTFNLFSVEFTEFTTNKFASRVLVTGNLVGGGTVSQAVVSDGLFDGAGPVVDFQLETFNWTGLTRVTFTAERPNANSSIVFNSWGFDNLVTEAVVPEPASLTIWGGIGLVGILGVYRGRRKPRT